jgi:hypothetical protein
MNESGGANSPKQQHQPEDEQAGLEPRFWTRATVLKRLPNLMTVRICNDAIGKFIVLIVDRQYGLSAESDFRGGSIAARQPHVAMLFIAVFDLH